MTSRRFHLDSGTFSIHPARAIRRITTLEQARQIVEQLGPGAVLDLLRDSGSLPPQDDDAARQQLAQRLFEGDIVAVILEDEPRTLDAPKSQWLADLSDLEPTERPLAGAVERDHDDAPAPVASVAIIPRVEVLAIGDFNFSTDRTVMLPGPSTDGERQGDVADGIVLVASLLAHLRELDEERRVLVVGHTDAAGSVTHNLELSERRADNVRRLLAGDRDGWAAHSHAHATVSDGQEVLRWVAQRFGWPCDPGPVDGDDGPATTAGRGAFRARYAHEQGQSAGLGDGFELADWRAFFDVYTLDLAARLGVEVGALEGLRARLVPTTPAVLGCGEHWPNDGLQRPPVCRENRRVEVLLFRPDELPTPLGGDDPPGKSIYEVGAYQWLPITVRGGPHPLEGPCFELALAIDEPSSIPAAATLRLHGGPYDLRRSFAGAKRDGGVSRFHFHGIAAGARYSLEYEPPKGEAVTLFVNEDLDAYIEAIGDAEAELRPIVFRGHLPFAEVVEDDGPVIDGGERTVSDPPRPRPRPRQESRP